MARDPTDGRTRLLPLVVAAGVLGLLAVPLPDGRAQDADPGEAVELRPSYEPDLVVERTSELDVELSVRVLVIGPEGSRVHRSEAGLGRRRVLRDTIRQVRDGRPVDVLRDVVRDRTREQPPGAPEPTERTLPLEGRSLVVQETTSGRRVRPADPSRPLPADLGEIDLEERLGHALPIEPVRPGESWRIEGERFRASWGEAGGTPDGWLEGRLESVETTDDGDRRATVSLTVDASGESEEERRHIRLEGTATVDLDGPRLLSIELEGTATREATEEDPDGTTVRLHGEGPARLTKTFTYEEPATRRDD